MSRYPSYHTKIVAGRLVTVPDRDAFEGQGSSYRNPSLQYGHHQAVYSRSQDDGMALYNRSVSMNWSANREAQSNKARALAQTYHSVLSPEPEEDLIVARPSVPTSVLAKRVTLSLANVSQEKLQTSYYTLVKLDMEHSGKVSLRDLWDVLLLYQIFIAGDLLESILFHFKAGNGKIFYRDLWKFFFDCLLPHGHDHNEMIPVQDYSPKSMELNTRNPRKRYEAESSTHGSCSQLGAELFCELHDELKRYARKEQQLMNLSQLTSSLKNCDRGGSGMMGFKEMKVLCNFYLPLTDALLDALLLHCDANKNGWVNYHEFVGLIQNAQPTILPPIHQNATMKPAPESAPPERDNHGHFQPNALADQPTIMADFTLSTPELLSPTDLSIKTESSKNNRKKWQANMSTPGWVMRKALHSKLEKLPLLERRKKWEHSSPVVSLNTLRQKTHSMDDLSDLSKASSVCSDYVDRSSASTAMSSTSKSEIDLTQLDALRLESLSPELETAKTGDVPSGKALERRGTYTKSTDLELQWIYGWSDGQNPCQPLVNDITGELIYSYGTYVVMLDVVNQTQRFYTEHSDVIQCFSSHHSLDLAASAQNGCHGNHSSPKKSTSDHDMPSVIHIWKPSTLARLRVIDVSVSCSHILAMAFVSHVGSELLAILGRQDVGTLSLWQNDDGTLQDTKQMDDASASCLAVSQDHSRLMTYGEGHVLFWRVSQDDRLSCVRGDFKHHSSQAVVTCGIFVSSTKAITGDSTGTVIVWNVETHEIESYHQSAHSSAVSSLTAFVDHGTWLSASATNCVVLLWQPSSKFTRYNVSVSESGGICGLAMSKQRHLLCCTSDNNVWTVMVKGATLTEARDEMKNTLRGQNSPITCVDQSIDDTFLIGSKDGSIASIQVTNKRLHWLSNIKSEVSALATTSNRRYIYSGTTNGRLHCLDIASGRCLETCKLSASPITRICISGDDCWMCVCFTEGRLGLFDLDLMTLDVSFIRQIKLPSVDIETYDWSSDFRFIRLQLKDHKTITCDLRRGTYSDNCTTDFPVVWLTELSRLEHLRNTYSCTMTSPNGKCRCYGYEKGLTLVRYTGSYPQQPVVTLNIGSVGIVAFSSDSKHLFAVHLVGRTLLQWKIESN